MYAVKALSPPKKNGASVLGTQQTLKPLCKHHAGIYAIVPLLPRRYILCAC